MSEESVLIAAFSARALAQSARRAGFAPLVVDCFGDEDTRAAAAGCACLPECLSNGFKAKSLLAALEGLATQAASPPIGLVLGTGFEDTPQLVASLQSHFNLISNPAGVIERTKSPDTFFAALDRLGIRYPQTRSTPPTAPQGWLRKRVGSSGGMHVLDCPPDARADPHHYFQMRIPGQSISALGILGPASSAFAFSRQWTSPTPGHPHRFGGTVGSIALDEDLEGRLIDAALAVTRELGLAGLVSFDFLIDNGEPFLIEVNPRPGATLDVFDDAMGTLFSAHIEGFADGGDPTAILAAQWAPPLAKAVAYLYADAGELTIDRFDWPPWTADRPGAGQRIARNKPIATVMAEAATPEEAARLCESRLGLLTQLLYETPKGKDTH